MNKELEKRCNEVTKDLLQSLQTMKKEKKIEVMGFDFSEGKANLDKIPEIGIKNLKVF